MQAAFSLSQFPLRLLLLPQTLYLGAQPHILLLRQDIRCARRTRIQLEINEPSSPQRLHRVRIAVVVMCIICRYVSRSITGM
ncbi:hypothetical protein FPV67DRAFT_1468831 [Lyophyllum atratum]|nr:hypothetical protein FPV67DRAFT_1468831 [Lyophyllum atratum]